eukprot:scaffold165119_cov33-Prasinocladus_malaysianus.AAC.1
MAVGSGMRLVKGKPLRSVRLGPARANGTNMSGGSASEASPRRWSGTPSPKPSRGSGRQACMVITAISPRFLVVLFGFLILGLIISLGNRLFWLILYGLNETMNKQGATTTTSPGHLWL